MSVAHSYAKALLEAATENQLSVEDLSQMESQLGDLLKSFQSSRDVRVALLSPLTSSREKQLILTDIGQKQNFSPILSQFVALLSRKGRLGILSEIRDAFFAVRLAFEGVLAGCLVVAEPMSEADIVSLSKAFSQRFGKKVAFRVTIDPALLAGMKVTVNGVTYDGSLRSQIQKLRNQLVSGIAGFQV
jgi:F-type H+-transporting ATPase subunit delta